MARKKHCEFCESDWIKGESGPNGWQSNVEWYPDNGLFAVTAFSPDETGESVEHEIVSLTFNYCPMCGRKVGF